MPEGHDRVGGEKGKILGLVVSDVAPGPEEHARLFLARVDHFGVGSLNKDGQGITGAVVALQVSAEGHKHVVVLGLSESAADRGTDADDLVGVSLGADGFADGIDVGEKFFGEVGADEHHFGAVLFVSGRNEAALGDGEAANVDVVGGDAGNGGVLHDGVAAASLGVPLVVAGDGFSQTGGIAKTLELLERNEGALLGFDPFVATGDDAEAVDDEDIGAEVGDAIGDVQIETGNDAHDRNEGGDGENDAEESKEAAELVSAESVESKTHGFGEGNPATADSVSPGGRHGHQVRQTRDTREAIDGGYAQNPLVP